MDPKLKSHFLSIYCMTIADHSADPKELEAMYEIGTGYYGLTAEEINSAILSEGTALYVPDDLSERILYLYDLSLIAWANGVVDDEEVVLLNRYAKEFGISDDQIDAVIAYLLDMAKNKVDRNEILKAFNK